jgi:hypothetical protein
MCFSQESPTINSLGLYEKEFSKEIKKGTIRIGIVGGSVANLMVQTSKNIMVDELVKSGQFEGREIEIINLAIPGFKQPQQVNLIVYLISLGYRFDAIADVAGLNEIYLSRHYNIRYQTSYAYPSVIAWYPSPAKLLGRSINSKSLDTTSGFLPELLEAESYLRLSAILVPTQSVWANSAFVRWISLALVLRAEQRVRAFQRQEAAGSSSSSFSAAEREFVYGVKANDQCSDPNCTDERVRLWVNGAVISNSFLKEIGIRYFEVLQPNPYTVPRQTLPEQDRRRLNDDFGWELSDDVAWKEIQAHIIEFARSDAAMKAIDLSDPGMVFADVAGGVLVDGCCHLNRAGYDALGREIASYIAANWAPQLQQARSLSSP